jgi:hypothetical protein
MHGWLQQLKALPQQWWIGTDENPMDEPSRNLLFDAKALQRRAQYVIAMLTAMMGKRSHQLGGHTAHPAWWHQAGWAV